MNLLILKSCLTHLSYLVLLPKKKSYYFIAYREDVTGISEGKIVAGKFETLQEASDYAKAQPQKFQADSPYFIHLAQLREDGHFYFLLVPNQIIHITIR